MQLLAIFRALSDPSRLRILNLVKAMELSVGEIAQVLRQSQPGISRHIGILCDAGLAERRREGSWIYLRAALPGSSELAFRLLEFLEFAEDHDPEFGATSADDRKRLAAIQQAREGQAQGYFAQHAESWDELRRLHGGDVVVEEALLENLGDTPLGHVLDIGTGTGRIAELLSGRATKVTALDKSPAMLRLARARLQHLGADQVDMVQGDLAALPFALETIDTVLFHQVLHFAQAPGQAVREAARVLRPGGLIAIVDFAPHQREELRERHAHAWLGFSDEQMRGIFTEAGLDAEAIRTIEAGELAVKIWTARKLTSAGDASR